MEKFLVVQNVKFVVTGMADQFSDRKFTLILPRGKHYAKHAVKSGEHEMHVEDLLYIAVDRTKSEAFHIKPFAMINDELVNLPRTLQYLMSKHSYPLSQGPVLLPIDCHVSEKWEQLPKSKSISKVLSTKTTFSHDEKQGCFDWSPVSGGVSAWGQGVSSYELRVSSFQIFYTRSGEHQGHGSGVLLPAVQVCDSMPLQYLPRSKKNLQEAVQG